MMRIGGVTGAGSGVQPGSFGMQTDSVSRNIQRQIEAARKRLQELSSNQELSMEEKMKQRQEIQQEITNLNQQLRQHQMEQRKEQQAKRAASEEASGSNAKAEGSGNGLSKAGMRAMLSADSSLKQAQVQGNVATGLKDRAGVLKAEIKQDKGQNTQAKEAELAEVEQKAGKATASQMDMLKDANKAAAEASKAEQSDAAEKNAKKPKDREGIAEQDSEKESEDGNRRTSGLDVEQETLLPSGYKPVDIRL